MSEQAREIAFEVVKLLEEQGTFTQTFEKSQAAKYLCVSVSTLENLLPEIPHSKVGRKLVFMRSDLDSYLRSKRRKTNLKDEVNHLLSSLSNVTQSRRFRDENRKQRMHRKLPPQNQKKP